MEEGGETAFPMADNTTRNIEVRFWSGDLEMWKRIFAVSSVRIMPLTGMQEFDHYARRHSLFFIVLHSVNSVPLESEKF